MVPASPRGWQDQGKSGPSLCSGKREARRESHGIFHLREPWKGQQGLPKPVVIAFSWVDGRLRGEAHRIRQIHVVPKLAFLVLEQLLLAE